MARIEAYNEKTKIVNNLFFGGFIMGKQKKQEDTRKAISTKPAGKDKCIECGAVIMLSEVTYNMPDKSGNTTAILPAHRRCSNCQDIHVVNISLNKVIIGCRDLKRRHNRMTDDVVNIVVTKAEQEFKSLLTKLCGAKEAKDKEPMFNIKDLL